MKQTKRVAISVISIGRNCSGSVEGTFRSVMNQEFDSFEYIIIDGASTDGTLEHVKSMLGGDSRITLVSEPDDGISDAMNRGVHFANGTLVIHLHFGDKFVNEKVLARAWSSYLSNGWSWAAGNLRITRKGHEAGDFTFRPSSASNLRRKNCVPHQATFIRVSEFIAAGGFDVSLTQAMDYDLWLRLHYVRKLELFDLHMDVASFDSTGESSRIFSLLKGSFTVRRRLSQTYGVNLGILEDIVFMCRIVAYWIYYKTKSVFGPKATNDIFNG